MRTVLDPDLKESPRPGDRQEELRQRALRGTEYFPFSGTLLTGNAKSNKPIELGC